MQPVGEYDRIPIAAGIDLHLHNIGLYKTTRVDICLSEPLRPRRNSELALISRLLERGTRDLPDLQSFNRFIDDLYGAHYYAEVDRMGDFQVIHLCLEVVDSKYIDAKAGDLLARGMRLLRDILLAPAGDGGGFHAEYLAQEKRILSQHFADRFNDKLAFAQQRCVEEMCRGESVALSALGDPSDFAAINEAGLLRGLRDLLAQGRIDLFFSGDLDPGRIRELVDEFLVWDRFPEQLTGDEVRPSVPGAGREVFECQDVHQAKLVMGYRSPVRYGARPYPALALLNLILGGEGPSRLFKTLREEQGLCYYIASHIDALQGLLFVVAGIEAEAYAQTRAGIELQLAALARGAIADVEIAAARQLLRAHLLGLCEDREAYFRYWLRAALVGDDRSPTLLYEEIARVGVDDLARVAEGLVEDTSYLLHSGGQVREAG